MWATGLSLGVVWDGGLENANNLRGSSVTRRVKDPANLRYPYISTSTIPPHLRCMHILSSLLSTSSIADGPNPSQTSLRHRRMKKGQYKLESLAPLVEISHPLRIPPIHQGPMPPLSPPGNSSSASVLRGGMAARWPSVREEDKTQDSKQSGCFISKL